MVWVIFALLTGLAALCALWPLSRRRDGDGSSAQQFYQAQLAQIAGDVERGQLQPSEAEALRIETARRLLAANAQPQPQPAPGALGRRRLAAALILITVPALALGGYRLLGRPEIADAPLATRAPPNDGSMSVDAALAKLETHLQAFPDDAKGFTLLGHTYMSLARYDAAARAYANALRVQSDDATLRAEYGEALVAAAGGVVTANAKAAFERALAYKPELVKAQFYSALATEQDGRSSEAIVAYQKILDQTPQTSTLRDTLQVRIAVLKGEPPPKTLSLRERAEGASDLAPSDQDKMIRGMVEGLAARLGQNGADAPGWRKLIRAYAVLKEADKAKAALEEARKALAKDSAGLEQVEAEAKQLGVGG